MHLLQWKVNSGFIFDSRGKNDVECNQMYNFFLPMDIFLQMYLLANSCTFLMSDKIGKWEPKFILQIILWSTLRFRKEIKISSVV